MILAQEPIIENGTCKRCGRKTRILSNGLCSRCDDVLYGRQPNKIENRPWFPPTEYPATPMKRKLYWCLTE